MKKIIKLLHPSYLDEFKCIGGECEDNCCVIQNRHFLLSEFFSRYTFHLNKRAKINFHTVLLGDVVVRRFL